MDKVRVQLYMKSDDMMVAHIVDRELPVQEFKLFRNIFEDPRGLFPVCFRDLGKGGNRGQESYIKLIGSVADSAKRVVDYINLRTLVGFDQEIEVDTSRIKHLLEPKEEVQLSTSPIPEELEVELEQDMRSVSEVNKMAESVRATPAQLYRQQLLEDVKKIHPTASFGKTRVAAVVRNVENGKIIGRGTGATAEDAEIQALRNVLLGRK